MKRISSYKNILWDFDGVLMDSMPIRDSGFKLVLAEYPESEVEALMKYHRKNGGLSRYVKFRYFFDEVRGEAVSNETILSYATRFSEVMRRELINPTRLIVDSISFVRQYHQHYRMHIVSGSDQDELRFICQTLDLSRYFHSIHGSPEAKDVIVRNVLSREAYQHGETMLIGDSHNDQTAAQTNGIDFFGYNNLTLIPQCQHYIESFES